MRKPVGAAGGVPIAGCEIVTPLPAIVADVERDDVALFAPILNVTVPLPVPEAPEAMLIQELCSDSDQVHPLDAVTANDVDPPARATERDTGETEYVHVNPD